MHASIHPDLTIESASARLTDQQKAEFFDVFWKAWAANGFGTLSKKDTDLLIFGCLKRACGSDGPRDNYGWAKLLRLTPSKIKAMRLEAHLRFGHLLAENSAHDAAHFLNNFSQVQSVDLNGLDTDGSITDVTTSFLVEDPVVQMEIEQRLKNIGTYLDFHRNREVIKIRLTGFLLIVADDPQKRLINRWVAEKAKEAATAGSLKERVTAKEYANKTEGGKLMTFVEDLLATFTQLKPLADHLKMICAAQSERKQ